MTRRAKIKTALGNYAPNVTTMKRFDYKYATCNGRVISVFEVDHLKVTIEMVANRRVAVDYGTQKAWTF